jgi:hypothetical protein
LLVDRDFRKSEGEVRAPADATSSLDFRHVAMEDGSGRKYREPVHDDRTPQPCRHGRFDLRRPGG